MSSRNTYRLTWAPLTLDVGYLLTAAPPDLEHGVASLDPPAPMQPLLLGAILHRNLECWVHESRQIGSGQTGDGKSERQHSRNQ